MHDENDFANLKDFKDEFYGKGHYLKIEFKHGNGKTKTVEHNFELLRASETTSETNNQREPPMIGG